MMTGIILFAHGSPIEEANQGVRQLAVQVAASGHYEYVRAAFLDGGEPDLAAAVDQAANAGINQLIIVPYFLTVGLHLRRDLPKLIDAARAKHPTIRVVVGQSLEDHPQMTAMLLSRINDALPQ